MKYNTYEIIDSLYYSNESMMLYNDAVLMMKKSMYSLEEFNEKFEILSELSSLYSLEDFQETVNAIKDKIKTIGIALVESGLRIIQSIKNFILHITTWVKEKLHEKDYLIAEKFKSVKSKIKVNKDLKISVIRPTKRIDSGKKLVNNIHKGIEEYNIKYLYILDKLNRDIIDKNSNKFIKLLNGDDKTSIGYDLNFAKQFNIPIAIIKMNNSKKISNYVIFGKDMLAKEEMNPYDFLKYINYEKFLSSEDLSTTSYLIKSSRQTIKSIDKSIELTKKVLSAYKNNPISKQSRRNREDYKLFSDIIEYIQKSNYTETMIMGIVYNTYNSYLRLRSYTVNAIKLILDDAHYL